MQNVHHTKCGKSATFVNSIENSDTAGMSAPSYVHVCQASSITHYDGHIHVA
jgi:hypothetical protein